MESKVYCVFQDYGSWDDYANNLVGVFLTNEEAEDIKNQLMAGLEKFRTNYPSPIRPGYNPEEDDASEADIMAYGMSEDEWHKAVLAAEKYEMMRVNHYSVVEKPLNQLFTEYQYFLV